MTLTEILEKRQSVRRFDGRAVPRGILERLLRLTLTAPSSRNVRSSRFIVVEKAEQLAKISEMRDYGSAFVRNAPCGIIVLGDASETDLWLDNAAISATVLQLAAEEAGLGSCWVHINGRPHKKDEPQGVSAEDFLRVALPVPQDWKPLCFVALGYPEGEARPRPETDDTDKIVWL